MLSLGLVDESKTIIKQEYIGDKFVHGAKYDPDKRLYYIHKEINAPMEVTDEEYQEILKYAPIVKKEKDIPTNVTTNKLETNSSEINNKWSNIVKTMAKIYLYGGTAINVISLIATIFFYNSFNEYTYNEYNMYSDIENTILSIFIIIVSYPFIMGLSKIIEAAEKFLQK